MAAATATGIAQKQTLNDNGPVCPVCGTSDNRLPGKCIVFSESPDSFQPSMVARAAAVICRNCGVVFCVKDK